MSVNRRPMADVEGFTQSDLGKRVFVGGKVQAEGVLAFVGTHHEKEAERVGIVLDNPGTGLNDGIVGDVVYFDCPAGEMSGVLCAPKHCKFV